MSSGPFAVSTTSTNSFVDGRPLFTLQNPFASPGDLGSLNINGISPRLLNSYTMQYSLSLERELRRDIGLRISYIGSKGSQLIYRRNVNQPPASLEKFSVSRRPYPAFNTITYSDNGANMLYSGLQVDCRSGSAEGCCSPRHGPGPRN